MPDVTKEKLREWTTMAEDYDRLKRALEHEKILSHTLSEVGETLEKQCKKLEKEHEADKARWAQDMAELGKRCERYRSTLEGISEWDNDYLDEEDTVFLKKIANKALEDK